MSGKFEAVVVCCMDGRLVRANNRWIMDLAGDDLIDFIAVPGGVRGIIQAPERSDAMKGIMLSLRQHGVRRVILLAHEDCGAYGGSAAIGECEREFQINQLQLAARIIELAIPKHAPSFELYYANKGDFGRWCINRVG